MDRMGSYGEVCIWDVEMVTGERHQALVVKGTDFETSLTLLD